MPELQIILTAIQDMKDSHNKCMESLNKEFAAKLGAVNDNVIELKNHVLKQNSNVALLQDESNKRLQAVIDFRAHESKHKKRDEWIKKNMVWIILGFILFTAIVVIIIDIVGAKVIITKAIEKVSMM